MRLGFQGGSTCYRGCFVQKNEVENEVFQAEPQSKNCATKRAVGVGGTPPKPTGEPAKSELFQHIFQHIVHPIEKLFHIGIVKAITIGIDSRP